MMIKKMTALATACLLLLTVVSCGSAGGRRASDWKGTWYREGDAPFSRCQVTIDRVNRDGFDFSLTVYNGLKAGEMKDCHAAFEKKHTSYFDDTGSVDADGEEANDNASFYRDNVSSEEGFAAYYYAEDPRSYIEFSFDEFYGDKLNIAFCTTGDFVEWTAFEGFSENAQITGLYGREENYVSDSLSAMGVLDSHADAALKRLMGSDVYFRLVCCFQNYTSERSDTSGANLPYEYGGQVHMHDGIGGTIYYGSMVGQQYAACVIAYDDGSVSAAVSMEHGAPSYYSDNWVYEKQQPYPILVWVENYTKEQNGELPTGVQ